MGGGRVIVRWQGEFVLKPRNSWQRDLYSHDLINNPSLCATKPKGKHHHRAVLHGNMYSICLFAIVNLNLFNKRFWRNFISGLYKVNWKVFVSWFALNILLKHKTIFEKFKLRNSPVFNFNEVWNWLIKTLP